MRLERTRWFPKDAEVREFPDAGLTVGVLTIGQKGLPVAIGYWGKSAKPGFNYSFRTAEKMEAYIAERVESGRAHQAYKAKQKAERKANLAGPNPLKVGDILCCSWGYDQTNVDYFQVLELIGKRSVKIREIGCRTIEGSEGMMCDRVVPVKDLFLEKEEPMIKRVGADGYVKIYDFANAYPISGSGQHYRSWYA